MRRSRVGVPVLLALVMVVVAGALVALPAAVAGEPGEPEERAREVLRRTVVLTPADRVTGIPDPGQAPHERLVEAEVSVDLEDEMFFGSATLAGEFPGESPWVQWNLGRVGARGCELLPGSFGDTFPGVTYTNEREDLPAGWERADCAVVTLFRPGDAGTVSDQLVGRLVDELPRLKVGAVDLLGSKRIKLVKGVWTKLDVVVRNTGPGVATKVVVSGKGAGLTVRPGRIGYDISKGREGSATIQVKLVRAKSTRLSLTASSGRVRAKRAVPVRSTRAPALPKPGSYRSENGDVTFRITSGARRVTQFRVRARTTCGGYPDIPTTTWNTYDFPTTRIARSGIIDATDRGSLYTANLELLAKGAKVTRGMFSYSGPNRCFAKEWFTAARQR